MKNLYKVFEKILVIENNHKDLKQLKYLRENIVYDADGYYWIDISKASVNDKDIVRVFEKFYVYKHHENTHDKSIVYDAISAHYQDIIDLEQNIDSNKTLCNLLVQNYSIKNIVDFGCGTGLSYKYCMHKNINVLGVDKSNNMLEKANKNGLINTCQFNDFYNIEYIDFFDGAIASYVFHIIQDTEELDMLCNSLKPNSRIIANFFKEQNIQLINDYFKSKNWSIHLLDNQSNYSHGSIYEYIKPDYPLFIDVSDTLKLCGKFKQENKNLDIKYLLEFLIEKDIITYFKDNKNDNKRFILYKDFNIYINTMKQYNIIDMNNGDDLTVNSSLFVFPISFDTFILSNDKNLDFKNFKYDINSIIKNLFYNTNIEDDTENSYKHVITFKKDDLEYKFVSKSKNKLKSLSEQIVYLENHFDDSLDNAITSPNYLGKKKKISTFILNIIRQFTNNNTIMLDLMTGSGSVAGQMAKYWPTYASDLQEYANIFAYSQGKGFSEGIALKLIEDFFQPTIKKNLQELLKNTNTYVEKEYVLLNSKITEETLKKYIDFIKETPFYRTDLEDNKFNEYPWNPYSEVNKRKKDNGYFPYCLTTCYFSNCYFGFYQSLEIDSIRYAINSIKDENIKKYALSALLTTISYSAQGYGGHLAQPLYENEKNITLKNISNLFRKRSKLIMPEFFDRLISIGKQSEVIPNKIQTIKGPWQNALKELNKIYNDDVLVYVDPPYTYDEYGRYYHIFETLTLYNYPESINRGRTPNKKQSERYPTKFTSKSQQVCENEIISIVKQILNSKWICVLSYASSGLANMINIMNAINNDYDKKVDIFIYSTKHNHTVQGKKNKEDNVLKKSNMVIEYLIVFKYLDKKGKD